MSYNPGNFQDVADPVVRNELRKLWQVVQTQRGKTDDRLVTKSETDAVKRRLLASDKKTQGYRATTIPGGDGAPKQAEVQPPAPTDAPYILMDHNAALPNHRRLQAGVGMALEDSGPGGNATLRLSMAQGIAARVYRFAIPLGFGTLTTTDFGMGTYGPGGGVAIAAPSASRLGQISRTTVATGGGGGSVNFSHSSMGAAQWIYRGGSPGLGGFHSRQVFGIESLAAVTRWFFGVRAGSTGTAYNTNWNTLVNCVVMGSNPDILSPDGKVYVYHNDASGLCNTIDTGLTWGVGDIFQFDVACDANAATMTWTAVRTTDDGTTYSTTRTISTNLPANTTALAHHQQVNNGLTGGICSLSHIYTGLDQPYGI